MQVTVSSFNFPFYLLYLLICNTYFILDTVAWFPVYFVRSKHVFLYSKMSSLIQQFSGWKRESPVWQYFDEKADMRQKANALLQIQKEKFADISLQERMLLTWKHTCKYMFSDLFNEFKENEQERNLDVYPALNRKQDETGITYLKFVCVSN